MPDKVFVDIFGKPLDPEPESVQRPNFERMLDAISRAQTVWDQGDAYKARAMLRAAIEHSELTRLFAWRPRTVEGGRVIWLRHIYRREVRSWGSSTTRIEYFYPRPRPEMFPELKSSSVTPP